MNTKPNTQFVSDAHDAVLVFTDYPSLVSGTVFFGVKERDAVTHTFHAVKISQKAFGEMDLSAPTAKVQGKFQIRDEFLVFNGWAYVPQNEPFPGELTMFEWSKVDRSAYSTYKCEHFIKGVGDGVIVYVIAPVVGTYADFVVFAGTGENLYEVPQYKVFERFRTGGDVAHVTFDAEFLRKTNLKYAPGDYTIEPGNGTWKTLCIEDFNITFKDAEATIKQTV